jgi:glucosamine--fructose-6-phosphate aminotransferase (isomerizing)
MNRLLEMIGSQPQTLTEVAALDIRAEAERLAGARRLLIIGTGTSHHAAQLGAYLMRGGGLEAQAFSSAEFARWHPAPRAGDALIVISHTGETAYARASRDAGLAARVPVVTITGTAAAWDGAIETPTNELSETYTVSYTAALAVLGLLAHALTGTDTGPDAIGLSAGRVAALIADPGIAEISVPRRSLAVIGPGIWGVTAREGALKLRESAHVLAEGYDSELFLHGSAVPFGSDDTLIALAPEADPDGLTSGLVDAAAQEGLTTHVFAAEADGDSAAEVFLAQLVATVRLQLLAARFSQANGTNPDQVITGAWAGQSLWSAGSPSS